MDKDYDWMEEALQIAGQCWCDESTSGKVVDPVLGEAIAKRIAMWMQNCAQAERNAAWYRQMCEMACQFLPEPYRTKVYTDDVGSVHTEPLIAKLPEVILELKHDKVWKEFDAKT